MIVARRRLLVPHGAPSGPFIYWANNGDTTIGRANLDGSGVNQSFITAAATPIGLAVNDQGVLFSLPSTNTIVRTALDGTGAANIITDASTPQGLAIDSTFVYIANGGGTVGRAQTDGSGDNESFIASPGGNAPAFLAVDAAHIYWTRGNVGTMGRSNLDGSGVNSVFFLSGAGTNLNGVAVDGTFIYWGNSSSQVGRTVLAGSPKFPAFISGLSGANVAGVAVDGSHIYWAESLTNQIGRANLDGSGVNRSFITGCNSPYGLAVH